MRLPASIAAARSRHLLRWSATAAPTAGLRRCEPWADSGRRRRTAVPTLMDELRCGDIGAAWTLGAIGPDSAPAAPLLIAALQHPDRDMRYAAVNCAGADWAGGRWRGRSARCSARRREAQLLGRRALGRIGPDAAEAVTPLAGLLGDPQILVRCNAAAAARIGPAARLALPALRTALASPDRQTAVAAAEAITKLEGEQVRASGP